MISDKQNHYIKTSNKIPPPSNALLTFYQNKTSKISIYFFKVIGILFYLGVGVFLYAALDIFLLEKDLKLVSLLFISSILTGFFGWVFNSVSKSFQKENELNKYIYLTLTPTEIIYQYLETNDELNRIVIPLHRFLKVEYDVDSGGYVFWYITTSGEKQYFMIGDYSLGGTYEKWKRLEELLEKYKEGILITITPSEIIYKYITKDSNEEKSVNIPRNQIIQIENCGKKRDDFPELPAIIIYRDKDGEIKAQKIEYEFVLQGFCKAMQDKSNTIIIKKYKENNIYFDEE